MSFNPLNEMIYLQTMPISCHNTLEQIKFKNFKKYKYDSIINKVYMKVINLVGDTVKSGLLKNETNISKYYAYNKICNQFINKKDIKSNIFTDSELNHNLNSNIEDRRFINKGLFQEYKQEYENLKFRIDFESRCKRTQKNWKRHRNTKLYFDLDDYEICIYSYNNVPSLNHFDDLFFNTEYTRKEFIKYIRNFTDIYILEHANRIFRNLNIYKYNDDDTLYDIVKKQIDLTSDYIYKDIEKILFERVQSPRHIFIEKLFDMRRHLKDIRMIPRTKKFSIYSFSYNDFKKEIKNKYDDFEFNKIAKVIKPKLNKKIENYHVDKSKKLLLIELQNKMTYKSVSFNFVNNMLYTSLNNIINTYKNRECSICCECLPDEYYKCNKCSSSVCIECYSKCNQTFVVDYNEEEFDTSHTCEINYEKEKKCLICMSSKSVNLTNDKQPTYTLNDIPDNIIDEFNEILLYEYERLQNRLATFKFENIYLFDYYFMKPYLKNTITEEKYNNICELEDVDLFLLMLDCDVKEIIENYLGSYDFIESVVDEIRENDDDDIINEISDHLKDREELKHIYHLINNNKEEFYDFILNEKESDIEDIINYCRHNYNNYDTIDDIYTECFLN